jgi:hypothetical protein
MSICCTGASLTVLVMELSMLVVILEATAKNSSRLKHCIEVYDTTHLCLSCSCNTVHFVFDVEGRPSVITNRFRNFNLVSIGQSRFKYLSILFEIVLIVLIPIGEFIHQIFSYLMKIFFRFPDNFNLTSIYFFTVLTQFGLIMANDLQILVFVLVINIIIQGVSEIRVLILTSERTRQFMKLFSITFCKIFCKIFCPTIFTKRVVLCD